MATRIMGPTPAEAAPLDPAALIDEGLLTVDETVATLRAVLGEGVTQAQLVAAAEALRDAQAVRWEQLPPEINEDMGFNYQFLACTETCWLGRQVLIEGATFRIFRLRPSSANS